MADSYNNFGVATTPVGLPTTSYNGFGVINSDMNGLSTIQNTVTESVSPQSLSFGNQVNDIQSANFKHGISGWKISANGDAEFQSLTGLTFTGSTINGATINGGTITGTTFKTNSSLPASGDGIVIDGVAGTLTAYTSGNPTVQIFQEGIAFASPLGVSSASIQGFGTNDLMVILAGSSAEYHLNTAYLYQDSGADLGTSSFKWGTVYATNGTINTSDIRIKTNITKLNYGLDEVMKLEPIRYSMYGKHNRIGLSAQAVNKVVPEATENCHDDSPIGTAGICATDLIPVLVNAIKELKMEIDILKLSIGQK